jgi:hypothetical protein
LHHITDFALGGPTSIDNGTLLCRFNHDNHVTSGWTCQMINGTPHWTPPTWIDPDRRPRRNYVHTGIPGLQP